MLAADDMVMEKELVVTTTENEKTYRQEGEMGNIYNVSDEEFDILNDVRYVYKASEMITNSLRSGCDVAQLPNGDLLITETKIVTTQYTWNKSKNKFLRSSQL